MAFVKAYSSNVLKFSNVYRPMHGFQSTFDGVVDFAIFLGIAYNFTQFYRIKFLAVWTFTTNV